MHLRVQFDVDLLDKLVGDAYMQQSFVMFTHEADRDAFDAWVEQLDEAKSPTNLLMPFSINEILAKGDLHVAARVEYPLASLDNTQLYGNNKTRELIRWIYRRTHRGETPTDIWYDRSSNQFLFEDANIGMEFKLTFVGEPK